MIRYVGILLVAVSLAATGIVLYYTTMQSTPSRLCFETTCFSVEIADTAASRRLGLMYREELAPTSGMLFVFPENGLHSFWMKNTNLSLDMLWLDENWQVVHIERNVPPCTTERCPSYRTTTPARYVLEVNAGAAQTIAIHDTATVANTK